MNRIKRIERILKVLKESREGRRGKRWSLSIAEVLYGFAPYARIVIREMAYSLAVARGEN